jgi:hypothetical protein
VRRCPTTGGRRATDASPLKLLNNQHLATEDRIVSRYRAIAKSAKKDAVPQRLQCVLFSPADADEWVLIKHGGQMEGAGTVEWDGLQRGRFNLRSGRNEQYGDSTRPSKTSGLARTRPMT